MSHPAHPRPRLLGSLGGMVSQEILTGTTAAGDTLQSGRSDRVFAREHILRTLPKVTHPTTDGADHGAAHLFLAARSV